LGALENDFTRATGPNFYGALIARALGPGCKTDERFVLGGPEGTGRSTICPISPLTRLGWTNLGAEERVTGRRR